MRGGGLQVLGEGTGPMGKKKFFGGGRKGKKRAGRGEATEKREKKKKVKGAGEKGDGAANVKDKTK